MTRHPLAPRVVAELTRRGERVAVAESLTGGALTSALVDVPGASAVVSGGVVAYATELKATLLGVDAALLDARGPIDRDVALAMADGVRERLALGAAAPAWGIATTGAAGPDPQDGVAPGTVWVACASDAGHEAVRLLVVGDRDAVRAAAVDAALELLATALGLADGSSE